MSRLDQKHEKIQEVGLKYFRQIVHSYGSMYHYTIQDRVNSILENGFIIKSPRITLNNTSRGVYFTSDPEMNYKETMNDLHSPFQDQDIYRFEIDIQSLIDNIFIDAEFHGTSDTTEEFIGDIEDLDGLLFGYINIDIDPKYILSVQKMDESNMKRNGTFSEF